MSLTPEELLEWAKNQPQDAEASCRAVMSRAYYAAYHHCHAFHLSLPAPGISSETGGVHEKLIHQLQYPAPETKGELRVQSKRKAQLLRALKHIRVMADYDLQTDIDDTYSSNAVAKAETLFGI